MNSRIYDGALGRFVQTDPIIQDPLRVQSLNRYSYVWNNPLNATDPSGFTKCSTDSEGKERCTDDQGKHEVSIGKNSCSSKKCQNYAHTKNGKTTIISINKKETKAFEKEMTSSGVSIGAFSNSVGVGPHGAGASKSSSMFESALGLATQDERQQLSNKLDFIEQKRLATIAKGGRGVGSADGRAFREASDAMNQFICENAGCGIEPVDPTLAVGLVYGATKLGAYAFHAALKQRVQQSLLTKGRLRIDSGNFSQSEVDAAWYMASQGKKVHLRQPVGARAGGGTSDMLVDGTRYDVYTPTSGNPGRIISAMAKKNSQTEGIVLDLRHSNVTAEQLGNALGRVNGAGAINIKIL